MAPSGAAGAETTIYSLQIDVLNCHQVDIWNFRQGTSWACDLIDILSSIDILSFIGILSFTGILSFIGVLSFIEVLSFIGILNSSKS